MVVIVKAFPLYLAESTTASIVKAHVTVVQDAVTREIYFTNFYILTKIQQTKMLVACKRFGDLFFFGLICQYSSNHKTYDKGRFKVIATYLQQ